MIFNAGSNQEGVSEGFGNSETGTQGILSH